MPEELKEELSCGYVVGIRTNGSIYFDLLGDNHSTISLLGLHKFAERRINSLVDFNTGEGIAVVQKMLGKIQIAFEFVTNLLTEKAKKAFLG